MKRGRESHGQRNAAPGLTLLETIFATFVLGLIFFVLMSLFPTSLLTLRKAHDLVAATDFAQQIMEMYAAEPFDSLADGTGSAQASPYGTPFDATAVVSTISADGRLKKIEVTVTWDTGRPTATGTEHDSIHYETRRFGFRNP